VIAALLVILAGALWVLRPTQMLGMAAAFLGLFFLAIGLLALGGQCFTAAWHAGPVCGARYWSSICLSPELLVFSIYMMSDPRTAPTLLRARLVYGAATAGLAALLIAPQLTEYGAKLALLVSLVVVCSLVPLIEAAFRPRATRRPRFALRPRPTPVVVAVLLIALSASAATWRLRHDTDILAIERGISRDGVPAQ
jgi:Na+-translocating ferredoxin:NAD+ oxidoreductase RnfD subunit